MCSFKSYGTFSLLKLQGCFQSYGIVVLKVTNSFFTFELRDVFFQKLRYLFTLKLRGVLLHKLQDLSICWEVCSFEFVTLSSAFLQKINFFQSSCELSFKSGFSIQCWISTYMWDPNLIWRAHPCRAQTAVIFGQRKCFAYVEKTEILLAFKVSGSVGQR